MDELQKSLKILGKLRRDIDLVLYNNSPGKSNYDYTSDDEYWDRIYKFLPKSVDSIVDLKKLVSSHIQGGDNS